VSLSETETFKKLPASTHPLATLKAIDTIKITNTGTDPFTGLLKVALLASPDDTVAGATTITSLSKQYSIAPKHTVTAILKFVSEAALSPLTYRLLSAVTQPDGTVTSSNPASAPTFTIIANATVPAFVPTILSATPVYAIDSSHTSSHHLTQLDLSMSIVNNGAVSIGADQFVPVRLHKINLRQHRHPANPPVVAALSQRVPRLQPLLPNRHQRPRRRPPQRYPHHLLHLHPNHRHLRRREHGELRHTDFLRGLIG